MPIACVDCPEKRDLNDSSDKGFNTGPANTVAFRQGSNVEFEGPSFVNTGHSGGEVRNRINILHHVGSEGE